MAFSKAFLQSNPQYKSLLENPNISPAQKVVDKFNEIGLQHAAGTGDFQGSLIVPEQYLEQARAIAGGAINVIGNPDWAGFQANEAARVAGGGFGDLLRTAGRVASGIATVGGSEILQDKPFGVVDSPLAGTALTQIPSITGGTPSPSAPAAPTAQGTLPAATQPALKPALDAAPALLSGVNAALPAKSEAPGEIELPPLPDLPAPVKDTAADVISEIEQKARRARTRTLLTGGRGVTAGLDTVKPTLSGGGLLGGKRPYLGR